MVIRDTDMLRLRALLCLYAAMCLLYNPCDGANSVKETSSFIISFKTLLYTGCVTLYTSENQNKEVIHKSIQIRKFLSFSEISTTHYNKGLSTSLMNRCMQNRPLVVIVSSEVDLLPQVSYQRKAK